LTQTDILCGGEKGISIRSKLICMFTMAAKSI